MKLFNNFIVSSFNVNLWHVGSQLKPCIYCWHYCCCGPMRKKTQLDWNMAKAHYWHSSSSQAFLFSFLIWKHFLICGWFLPYFIRDHNESCKLISPIKPFSLTVISLLTGQSISIQFGKTLDQKDCLLQIWFTFWKLTFNIVFI